MALTCYGKNEALNAIARGTAPSKFMKYVTLAEAIVSTGTEANTGAKMKLTNASTTGGLTVGTWCVFESVTGGKGAEESNSIVAGRPYVVVGSSGTGFEVSGEEGGAAITPTESVTGFVVAALKESGTARVSTAFAASSLGETADSTKTIEVGAGKKARYAMHYSHLTEAGAPFCMAITKLEVEEVYGAAGKYELSADKLSGNPATLA